ncbi:hypothetical protein [Streptomyces sp. NPDC059970]|uniref:hypothetical protein n=1 Tax=Streptomyces sp. NPDC059970 TaxID=3347019 RepID=UPI00367A2CEA
MIAMVIAGRSSTVLERTGEERALLTRPKLLRADGIRVTGDAPRRSASRRSRPDAEVRSTGKKIPGPQLRTGDFPEYIECFCAPTEKPHKGASE